MASPNTPADRIGRAFADPGPITAALQQAFRDAIRKHKQAGVPMVFWEDGKVIEVAPEDLPDPN